MPTAFVALSGGVDSSVAAAFLKEAGYSVVGVHILCWDECEQREDRLDALRVAVRLDIPFLTFDFREEYKRLVFDPMIREYAAGRTPNPDVECNREIKFGVFLKKALERGADYIATGHYVRLRSGNHGAELFEGIDEQKDQSYFLWALTQAQLRRCLLPLGDYSKRRVREIARQRGLPTANKKDSQGLCFVGRVNFGYFLRGYLPTSQGRVITSRGKEVGAHKGVAFYTIGQRHGLGLGGGVPYYVAGKNVAHNTLIVGEGSEDRLLYKKKINVKDLNWVSDFRQGRCAVRIRYRQPKVSALAVQEGEGVRVHFDQPQRGVAPGQSAVFYHGDRLLGGGIIQEDEEQTASFNPQSACVLS